MYVLYIGRGSIVNPSILLVSMTKYVYYLKVVGKAQATKSNLHNCKYRCLVVALIDVAEVLSQTL